MAQSNPGLRRPPGYTDPSVQAHKKPTSIPRSQIPPSFQSKRKRRSCCCCCCCTIIILILFLLIIFAIFGTLFYVWFQPKLPTFHLQSIKTPQFNVSVTPDGTYLDASTDVRFETTNPNSKLEFAYDDITVRISYEDDVDLGTAVVPAFTQGRRNITILNFETSTKHLLIDDDMGLRLKNQLHDNNMVVDVEVKTRVGVGIESWKLGMMDVKVVCENVQVKSSGGANPKCKINLLKWINIH
ncbi:hypothetical protein MKW98_015360 [Papaver atlanticum]|uniref:Late embryogenesis abundant protein LEA-2 subgroup domain-containing protein n=1 Tax=Papaver atlanticum TaxID=357466 RepID=A0AAD4X5P9_9MAGN|nr:hypothetical protein MKW98_015360 [Papaver atlanticum]